MFNPFAKKTKGTEITLKIEGMHCTSCSMNIDGELEDIPGVYSSKTSYAQSTTTIDYDPAKTEPKVFHKVIKELGYTVV